MVGVPVDDQGLVVDAIPPRTRLVYVTPSHQFPLGMAMSLPAAPALLAWAERHDAAIVEDDYDSEFRYGDRPIEPLQTLDRRGRVIYVGSFSKTLLATLRLGFLVAPASLVAAVRSAKFLADWHTPLPLQAALAEFIDQGLFARHLRKMRGVYQQRHQQIVEAPGRPVRRPPRTGPVRGRAARRRDRPHLDPRGAPGRAGPGLGGRGGAPAPVDVRRRPPQPTRHRPRLRGHPHRRHRRGPAPAPALLRRLMVGALRGGQGTSA